MKNILTKINQFESNTKEVNLSDVQVHLATIYDNLSATLQNANSSFFKALELRGEASKLCRDSITKNEAILKELNKVEPLIKQIGLDSELKKVEKAKQEVNKSIAIIDEALSNFMAI